jgi:uncharacterized protein (TIGR02270 family)
LKNSGMHTVAALPLLVRQHAEDAAFLFQQRSKAFYAHSWNDTQLGRWDQRLSANVAGLIAAGRTGRQVALACAEDAGFAAGEVFALCTVAIAQNDAVDETVVLASETPSGRHGLSGALAWLDATVIGPRVRDWLSSAEPALRHLGLVALSHHRRDPGDALASYVADPDPAVRSRAARLCFEMGRADMVDLASELAAHSPVDPWPAMALARFGRGSDRLFDYASVPDRPMAGQALDYALLSAPAQSKERLSALMRHPESRSMALSRAGVLSDRSIAEWLLGRMQDAIDAEAAGFAFLDLYPLDPDDCGLFTENPDSLGDGFAGCEPGLYPVADQIRTWLNIIHDAPPHRSLRLQMLEALRASLRDKAAPLQNWRANRIYPAWS